MSRLPVPGADTGTWGSVLNDFLDQGHNANGSLSGTLSVVNVKDDAYGAVGDGVNDDTAEIQAAIDAAAAANNGGTGIIYFPKGTYKVSASLTFSTAPSDYMIFGDGMWTSRLSLADNSDVPIIDTTAQRRFFMRDIGFQANDPTQHTQNTFPLLRMTLPYLGRFQNVLVWKSPGNGWEINGSDTNYFDYCMIVSCVGHGLVLGTSSTNPLTNSIVNCDIESNGFAGVYLIGASTRSFMNAAVERCRFELNGWYAVFCDHGRNIKIQNNYIDNNPGFYLNESTHHCLVEGNQAISVDFGPAAMIADAGWGNTIRNNDGFQWVTLRPKEAYYPPSRFSDGDMWSRSTSFWTGSGAGGTLSKGPTYVDTTRLEKHIGRGAPLKIAPSSGSGHGASQDIAVVAGETYLFDNYFWKSVGGTHRVKLQNATGPVDLWDSGSLSNDTGGTPEAGAYAPTKVSTVFQVPSGVTTLRVLNSSEDANPTYVDRCDLIRLANANGGMEGTFAAGIAPGWSNLSGTGTPASEATIKKSGATSQKISVTATNSYFLSQAPTIDLNRFYLLAGWINITLGDVSRAVLGWGTDLVSTSNCQVRLAVSQPAAWRYVSTVFRPNSQANLIIGVLSDAVAAGTAYFDDIVLMPLRNTITEKASISKTFTLSAAADSDMVVIPSEDGVLRRVTICYTVATDANAGVAIQVGTFANTSYYSTTTSAINQTAGTQQEATLTKTDIRAGTPVFVRCAGGKTGTGAVQVSLEYE